MKNLLTVLTFISFFAFSCEESEEIKTLLDDETKMELINSLNGYEFTIVNYIHEGHKAVKANNLKEYEATDYTAYFEFDSTYFKMVEIYNDCNYVDGSLLFRVSNEIITELNIADVKDISFDPSVNESHDHYIATITLNESVTVTTLQQNILYECDETIDDRGNDGITKSITDLRFNLSKSDVDKVSGVFAELIAGT